MKTMTFDEFAERYLGRQVCSPQELHGILVGQKQKFQPDGWMLLECEMMDSSWMGSLVILPYGQNNTYKEPPTRPISPRGLCSDMSIVVGILPTTMLPEEPPPEKPAPTVPEGKTVHVSTLYARLKKAGLRDLVHVDACDSSRKFLDRNGLRFTWKTTGGKSPRVFAPEVYLIIDAAKAVYERVYPRASLGSYYQATVDECLRYFAGERYRLPAV